MDLLTYKISGVFSGDQFLGIISYFTNFKMD